jgi:hypothetical protein
MSSKGCVVRVGVHTGIARRPVEYSGHGRDIVRVARREPPWELAAWHLVSLR